MNGLQLFPERASSIAGDVDMLYFFMLCVTAFFTILIFLLVVGFAIRYRRRSGDQRSGKVADSLMLEIAWSVIPLLITVVMFVWGAKLYLRAYHVPADAMEISVIGKQWMWKAQHPEGRREINELHLPLGRAVKLRMISQDVIHDFSLPAFRLKRDVLPGRYTGLWFEPTKVGRYRLFCSQYCGAQHAEMGGWIYVMEPAEYQAWLTGTRADEPPAIVGERLFGQYACMTCHGQRGPTLANLYGSVVPLQDGSTVIADDDYLRESILNPRAKMVAGYSPIMPTYKGQLSEEQINDLIAYIKSLKNSSESAPANLSTDDFITHAPLPNSLSGVPTSGPASPGASPLPAQPNAVKTDLHPTTQP